MIKKTWEKEREKPNHHSDEKESNEKEVKKDGDLIFKNGLPKQAWNFIGLDTNTWGPVHIWRNVLKRGDPGINRLDKIAKQHDIDYSKAGHNLEAKWKADAKMIKAIDRLPGRKTLTERIVKKIMQAKKRLKM